MGLRLRRWSMAAARQRRMSGRLSMMLLLGPVLHGMLERRGSRQQGLAQAIRRVFGTPITIEVLKYWIFAHDLKTTMEGSRN